MKYLPLYHHFKAIYQFPKHIIVLVKIVANAPLIKDEVLLTVGCPIFRPFYIDSQIFVHQKLKKLDQLIFRNAKEIYFNEKFPIL